MYSDSSEKNGNIVLGLKRGVVKDLNDPDKMNRIKVTLIDEELELPFADIMVKSANKEYGMVSVPPVGEEVIVGFLDGKINDPIILGSVFNSKNVPSLKIDPKTNEIMSMIFPMGLNINMNSKADKEVMTITTKKGHIVTVDDGSNEMVEVKAKSGKTSLKVDFKGGEILINAEKKMTLSAGQDSLVIEQDKGVTITSNGGKFTANVNEVALTAKANVKCTANAQFVAEGKSTADLKSSGVVSVKGSMTKVG